MKELFKRGRERLANVKEKAKYYAMAGSVAMMAAPTSANATALKGVQMTTDPQTLVQNIVGMICNLFTYVGAVVLVVGLAQVVMAFKSEDADGKTRGMLVAMCGVGLISIKTIVSGVTGLSI